MGVIYKLNPEIKDFVLEKRKNDPKISCRNLIPLIETKFQTRLSKSSINSIIKEAGLSMPVGRRIVKRHRHLQVQAQTLGGIFLKAADYLVGGSILLNQAIKTQLNLADPELLAKIEALVYRPLFGQPDNQQIPADSSLWTLINQQVKTEALTLLSQEISQIGHSSLDISKSILSLFQEVRCIKVSAGNSDVFYLDSQLYSVWPSPNIPDAFSTTVYNIKSYIDRYLRKDAPFLLFSASGYDAPTKEFLSFINNLDSPARKTLNLTLYNHQLEEIETVTLELDRGHSFVFGLWPWQFSECCQTKLTGEFKLFSSDLLKRDFYLADAEVELSQPNENKRVALRGCALKTSLEEKTRLLILTNLAVDKASAEDIANFYLSRWPNLEETLRDYAHKVELYKQAVGAGHFPLAQNLFIAAEVPAGMIGVFDAYLKALDLYARWHFLPCGYENKDFSTVKSEIYDLKATLGKENSCLRFKFLPPAGYRFIKDLEYACCRVNEREIILPQGLRLWLEV